MELILLMLERQVVRIVKMEHGMENNWFIAQKDTESLKKILKVLLCLILELNLHNIMEMVLGEQKFLLMVQIKQFLVTTQIGKIIKII